LAARGATITDLNTATSPTETVGSLGTSFSAHYLLINPGTKADAGTRVALTGIRDYTGVTDIAPALNVPGTIVSTATLMDGKEFAWAARVGLQSNSATVWDGKAVFGWLVDDTTPMADATGALTLATGGGLGFHVAESGVISYFGQQAAVTSATASGFTHVPVAANAPVWYDFEIRWKCTDASAGTGAASFWINGRLVGGISTALPMQSTQSYMVTYAIQNGPTQLSDLAVAYNIVAVTGPGR
jgi:hypothetical protein